MLSAERMRWVHRMLQTVDEVLKTNGGSREAFEWGLTQPDGDDIFLSTLDLLCDATPGQQLWHWYVRHYLPKITEEQKADLYISAVTIAMEKE